MDYGDPIHFTFIAVNGAGKGNVSEHVLSKKESGMYTVMLQLDYPTFSIFYFTCVS